MAGGTFLMLMRSGFIKPTRWILTRPQPPRTFLLYLWGVRDPLKCDPLKCDHPRPTFNGTIWFCKECGEPLRDSEERRQSEIEAFTW